jgi:hypothetical protein
MSTATMTTDNLWIALPHEALAAFRLVKFTTPAADH